MRRILTLSVLSLSLLGGVAAASPADRELSRDRRELVRDEALYRNSRVRPALRQERFEYRRGFTFVRGEWKWSGYKWNWIPGHYVRARHW